MKKHFMLLIGLIFPSLSVADTGIGVSVQNDNSIIYVPVDVSASFRIEPSVRYFKHDEEDPFKSEYESLELAIGLFGKKELAENLNFIYGGRIGYLESEVSYESSFSDTVIKEDGYSVAPTIGFEYFFSRNLSVGGEASIYFADLEGDEIDFEDDDRVNTSSEYTYTDTALNVRFYF